MELDSEKQNRLITEWFNNLLDNKINNEILYLENVDPNTVRSIRDLLFKYNADKFVYVSDVIEDLDSIENKNNVILFLKIKNNRSKFIGSKMLGKLKLLFVPRKSIFYNKMENYIDPTNIRKHPKVDISENERFLYYIEKVNPINLITNRTYFEIVSFLETSIKRSFIFMEPDEMLSLLLDKTNYKKENYVDFIGNLTSDIMNLKNFQILTSRLAVVIYRIANLNLDATTTEVGRYFHRELGSKSKTYNYRLMYKQTEADIGLNIAKDLGGKNFKAYDLRIDESERNTKIQIALKLIKLKKCPLDADTIGKLTDLPIKEIEKLIKQS